jgi:hypothetical protein
MPIEIKEIVLKASISSNSDKLLQNENSTKSQNSQESNDDLESVLQEFKNQILMECMELIAEQRITNKRR